MLCIIEDMKAVGVESDCNIENDIQQEETKWATKSLS